MTARPANVLRAAAGVLLVLLASAVRAAETRTWDEEALRTRAEAAYRARRLQEAIRLHEEIARAVPEERGVRLRLAELYRWNGQYPQARALYEEILLKEPGVTDASIGLGYTLLAQKEFAEARRVLEEVLGRKPDTADALLALGRLSYWEGNWREAERHLERGVAASPGYEEIRLLLRRVRWTTRPSFRVEWSHAEETEKSPTLRRDQTRLTSDGYEAEYVHPWSSLHRTRLARRMTWRGEENLIQDLDNYRVTDEGHVLTHESDWARRWTTVTTLRASEWRDSRSATYRFDRADTAAGWRQEVRWDEGPHAAALAWDRGQVLVKVFPVRGLRLLSIETWSARYTYQPTSRWRYDLGAGVSDYEKFNDRQDISLDVTHWLDAWPQFAVSVGWNRRTFGEDVAEYHSFDRRDERILRLNWETDLWADWVFRTKYIMTFADTVDSLNARQVVIPDETALRAGRDRDQSTSHKICLRAERFLAERWRLYAEACWSVNTDDYRTSSWVAGIARYF